MKSKLKYLSILIILFTIIVFYFLQQTKYNTAEITINYKPIIINLPENITINEGESFFAIHLENYINDKNHLPEEITWLFSGNQNLQLVFDNEKKVLTVNLPQKDWFGIDSVKLTAVDPGNMSDTQSIIFQVLPVNDSPELSLIPDQIISEGESFRTIPLKNYLKDPDNQFSEINWSLSGCNNIIPEINNSKELELIPAENNWFGIDTLIITASDPEGLKSTQMIILQILPVNDPPILTQIHAQIIYEDDVFRDIVLDQFVHDIDNENSEITWRIRGNKNLQITIENGNKLKVLNPPKDWFGKDSAIIYAADPENLMDSINVYFIVKPVNDPPIVQTIPDQTVEEGFEFQEIDLNKYVRDCDNTLDEIQWSGKCSEEFSIEIISGKARVTCKNPYWIGTDTITFTVNDLKSYSSIQVAYTIFSRDLIEKYPIVNSLKNITVAGVNDLFSVAVKPFGWKSKDLLYVSVLFAGTLALLSVDEKIQKEISHDGELSKNSVIRFGEIYGRTLTSQLSAAAVELYGIINNDKKAMQIGLEIFESYFIADNITGLLKRSFGRSRPSEQNGAYTFDSFSRPRKLAALPSGHTTLAFSLSTVLSSWTDNNYVKALIYTPAFLTAFSRMYENHHWASDVFLGAAIGHFVGSFLVNRHNEIGQNNFSFGVDEQGRVAFTLHF